MEAERLVHPDYPQLCEICDEELADVKKMKRHMKSHSYIRIKFKCEDCDFVGENDYSMDVQCSYWKSSFK